MFQLNATTTDTQNTADALRALTVESDPAYFLKLSASWLGFTEIKAEAAELAARFAGVDNAARDRACAALGMKLRRALGL